MKATLILKLIEAHSNGNEDSFYKALKTLSTDEEKKGNTSLANAILDAYSREGKNNSLSSMSPISDISFSVQNINQLPKDKDSALELLDITESKLRLVDVALPTRTKVAIEQIIREQKHSEVLLNKGVTPTNRIIFCGPPGCGKTMTAIAIAGEIDIPIAYVKLDGLVSSYLGQTGANIRKIFDYVRNKRIMLFLDEFDAIAKKRDDAHELGELKRVVTTLLQNMDNMPANVLLVAATNHEHLLDSAIWRRFNTSIYLEKPDVEQRKIIIEKNIRDLLNEYTLDSSMIIKLSEGMSGADITNFMHELAKHCIIQKIDRKLTDRDIASIWLQQSSLGFSDSGDTYTQALYRLNKNGVPIRVLEELTGISKSTLSYRFGKEEQTDGKQ